MISMGKQRHAAYSSENGQRDVATRALCTYVGIEGEMSIPILPDDDNFLLFCDPAAFT
jgi:hypothetical protein